MIIRDHTRQHAAEQRSPDQMLIEDQERIAIELSTSVIYTIHAIALRIANLVAEVDRPAADKLHRVMNDLDNAVAAIRQTVFTTSTDEPTTSPNP